MDSCPYTIIFFEYMVAIGPPDASREKMMVTKGAVPGVKMTLIDELCDDATWDSYLSMKIAKSQKSDIGPLVEFISGRKYRDVVDGIRDGTYQFNPARRILIPKPGTSEFRVIYSFKREDITEHMVLRVFAHLLQRYDGIFEDNLYSFRNDGGVQKAIARLRSIDDIGSLYGYKADITKYFNSIELKKMFWLLRRTELDRPSCRLIEGILSNPIVECEGVLMEDNERGIMPGLPFSTFLSNLYLGGMDAHFQREKVQYYRFADDILVLCESERELRKHVTYIRRFVRNRLLEINPSKEVFYKPGDRIEFLGLFIKDGTFDLNRKSLDRSLRKIRIEGRHYRRTVERGEKTVDEAVHCFLVRMDQRFFGWERNSKKCWTHWYFPMINTDESLKVIDHQIQYWVRYIITGKHIKGNAYRISYGDLKKYGYRTLVSRFYDRSYKSRMVNGLPCRARLPDAAHLPAVQAWRSKRFRRWSHHVVAAKGIALVASPIDHPSDVRGISALHTFLTD